MSLRQRIREANSRVSIYELLAERGIRVSTRARREKINCPVHDDRHKSAMVYPDSNEVWCWTCQATYDPIGLLVAEGMGYGEACALVERQAGIEYQPREEDEFWQLRREAMQPPRPKTYRQLFEYRWAVHRTVLEAAAGRPVDWSGFDNAGLDVRIIDEWRTEVMRGLRRAEGMDDGARGRSGAGRVEVEGAPDADSSRDPAGSGASPGR